MVPARVYSLGTLLRRILASLAGTIAKYGGVLENTSDFSGNILGLKSNKSLIGM